MDKKLGFFNILVGMIFKPVTTWKRISDNNHYKYSWLWFFIVIELPLLAYSFVSIKVLIISFVLINGFIWLLILIIWGFIVGGLNIFGVKANLSFKYIIRHFAFSNTVTLLFFPFTLIQAIAFPKSMDILNNEIVNPYTLPAFIDVTLTIISILSIVWLVVIMIIGIKETLKISYKKAIPALLVLPFCIVSFIVSLIFLVKLF